MLRTVWRPQGLRSAARTDVASGKRFAAQCRGRGVFRIGKDGGEEIALLDGDVADDLLRQGGRLARAAVGLDPRSLGPERAERRPLLDVLGAEHVESKAPPRSESPQDGAQETLLGIEVRLELGSEPLDGSLERVDVGGGYRVFRAEHRS